VQTLLNLLAGVALLVWGTHIVRSGVLRVFGADLRRILAKSTSNRASACLAGVAVTGVSLPVFWTGIMLIIVFALQLRWFPSSGMSSPYGGSGMADVLWHLVLPAITLGMFLIGLIIRLTRSSMLDVLGQDYVRTARAKGLSRRRVLLRHVLRNSLIPIVTLWGLDLAALFGGGALLIETVFNLHGVGQYAAESIGRLDVPPILVVTLLTAFFVVVLGALTDIVYAVLDPRIRLS